MEAPASSSSFSTTTSKRTTILSLPTEVLTMIVDLLPLRELVHINEVSLGWSEPRKAVLSTRTELVISKTIIDNHLKVSDLRLYLNSVKNGADKSENDSGSFVYERPVDFDRLSLLTSRLPPKMVDGITDLMPKLRVLWIEHEGGYSELWKIKHLLDHYRNQLKEVIVHFKGTVDLARDHLETVVNGFRETVPSLITSLNRLTDLDRLELLLSMPPAFRIPVSTVDLSVARRLKMLSVVMNGFSFAGRDALQNTYQRYAENNERLKELRGANVFHLNTVLSFGLRVSAALLHVTLVDQLKGAPMLAALHRLATQCPNLKALHLHLSFAGVSMAQVAEALVPCRSLIFLVFFNLNFDASQGPVARANAGFEPAAAAAAGQQLPSPEQQQPPRLLPVLPSVKVLETNVQTCTHKDFESMGLDVIFPNVEVVSLLHTFRGCQLCHFTRPSMIAL